MIHVKENFRSIHEASLTLIQYANEQQQPVWMDFEGMIVVILPGSDEKDIYNAWCAEKRKRKEARENCPTADELEAIARRLRKEAEDKVAENVVVIPNDRT